MAVQYEKNMSSLQEESDSTMGNFSSLHTVILPDWTLKKWGHSNFVFQHR